MVDQMAQRGFLAVSVQYNNTRLLAQSCLNYSERARGIFDATRSTSAVSTVCSLPQAGCGQGIVTSGISQGGAIAVLSANYAPQVQAVFAMSASDYLGVSVTNPLSAEVASPLSAEVAGSSHSGPRPGAGSSLSSCLAKANTAIPANRLTVINGADDPIFGSVAATQATSGISCDPDSTQCWSPDGSGAGWYLVTSSEKTAGTAGHCYMDIGGCDDIFDPKWLPSSTSNWSLGPNLDWLATLGTKRVYSASGQ
jgi:dienelactone hydrolase